MKIIAHLSNLRNHRCTTRQPCSESSNELPMRKITRREFLIRSASLTAACEAGRHLSWARSVSADAWPAVAVAKGRNTDSAADILKTALDGIGGIGRFVRPGQTVAIKPNATWAYPPGTASSTEPDVLAALILLVREAGAKRIIVMDRSTLWTTAEALQVSGLGKVVDELGVEKLFPEGYLAPAHMCTAVDFPNAKVADFRKIPILKAAVEADVRINMAVAKSHLVTKFTMCLKHMMGFMQQPNSLHVQLEQGIADLNTESAVQAHLHILEAIRVRLPVGAARQAGGDDNEITNPRRVKRLNQIAAGTDPVLIDAYGCINYFAVKPQELAHVKCAAEAGIGEMDVEKATAAGRLRIFDLGQPTPTPTPTMTVSPTNAPTATITVTPTMGPSPTPTRVPTNTPLSTPEPVATRAAAAVKVDGRDAAANAAVNPASFLSGALIPAAAVVIGAGVIVRQRLDHETAHGPESGTPDAPEEAGDAGEPSDQ
jgi:uncharacterized protein (DUF362 family)